jgi:hypothetical protein
MSRLRKIARFITRRPEVTVWGDARALPYTEGQAIVGRGSIGPGFPTVEHRR